MGTTKSRRTESPRTPFGLLRDTLIPSARSSAVASGSEQVSEDHSQFVCETPSRDGPTSSSSVAAFKVPVGFKLSIVIPVFNERATIAQVIARVASIPVPLQIVAVDDSSTDGTAEILDRLANRVPALTVIHHGENGGKGAAVRTGFSYAIGSVVIVQDADLEYDPHEILSLIQPIVERKADVVFGSRFLERRTRGSSWIHRLGNRTLTWLSNLSTGLALTDMETGYKAIRRECLEQIRLEQDRFGIEPEFTAKVAQFKGRLLEVPISYRARTWKEGKKIGWSDAVQAVGCIIRYAPRWRRHASAGRSPAACGTSCDR